MGCFFFCLFFFLNQRADLIWAAADVWVEAAACLYDFLLSLWVVSLQLYCWYLTFCHFEGLLLKCRIALNVNKERTKERRGECHLWEVTAIHCAVYRTRLSLQPQMLGKNKLPDTAGCQKRQVHSVQKQIAHSCMSKNFSHTHQQARTHSLSS